MPAPRVSLMPRWPREPHWATPLPAASGPGQHTCSAPSFVVLFLQCAAYVLTAKCVPDRAAPGCCRTVYELCSGQKLDKLEFPAVRGLQGVKEATVVIPVNPEGPLKNKEVRAKGWGVQPTPSWGSYA